ncbi:MAG: T9SS type A sorting domain-containing protein, partial [Bacteroidota bacterium]
SWLTAMFNGGYVIYDVFTRGCNDNVGCTRIILHLNNDNKAPTSVTASPNPVCQGSTTTTLTANGATLSPGASYVWYTGGCGTTFLANTGSTNTLVVSPSVTTTYWVRVEGGTYCASTTGCKFVTVTVNNTVSAVAPDISVCTGTNNIPLGAAAGGTISSISWTGGAGLGTFNNNGTPTNVTDDYFTPSVPNGSFIATLTVNGTAPCGNTSDNGTIAWGTGPGGWNGSYSTNWYDERNWCGYPVCTDNVTLPNNTTVLYQPTIDPTQAGTGPVPHASNTAACQNMVINSGATLTMTNSANLNVCGDWTNNGTFAAGNGTVTFMGSAAQNINVPSNNFFNIIIDNSSTGVTLAGGDQTVTGVLTLNDGVLHTGANKLISTSFSPIAITYGTDNTSAPLNNYLNSWIDGTLRRGFANNAGVYDFPVGTATWPALARLTNTAIAGPVPSYFDAMFLSAASYTSTGSFNSTIAQDFGMSYDFLMPDGIWFIEPNVQPGMGSTTYSLKLYFNGFDPDPFVDNEFAIVKRPVSSTLSTDWSTQPADGAGPLNINLTAGSLNLDNGTGRMVADGFALRFSMSSFSHFGIAKKNNSLPVELYYFRALCNNKSIDLMWSTVSETNNDFFTVEKSVNSIDFDFLTTASGSGNSNQSVNYSFTDDEPYTGTTYYRLSQTDFDGATEVLGTTAANCQEDGNEITIYPNPANNIVYLYINDDAEETFNIDFYNNIGELVYQKKVSTVDGKNTFAFLINNLAEGLYTIVINHSGMHKVTYLMINK